MSVTTGRRRTPGRRLLLAALTTLGAALLSGGAGRPPPERPLTTLPLAAGGAPLLATVALGLTLGARRRRRPRAFATVDPLAPRPVGTTSHEDTHA